MQTLKDQFIVAAQNGGIPKRKDFKENITDQITNASLDKLISIINRTDAHDTEINLTDLITRFVSSDTALHDDIDLHEYAKIVYNNVTKHDNIFKPLSKDYVVGYLSAMDDDEAQSFIDKIENTEGLEHDKNVAKGTKKVIEDMHSPKQIVFDMYNMGNCDILYFNWRDFQTSAKLETLD